MTLGSGLEAELHVFLDRNDSRIVHHCEEPGVEVSCL